MGVYKTDQRDILFNLNDVLNISEFEKYGFDAASVAEIISEFDKYIENEVYPTRIEADAIGLKVTPEGVKVPECLHKANKGFYDMGWYALGVAEDIEGTPVPTALETACKAIMVSGNVAWSMYPGLTKGAMNVMYTVGDDFIKKTFIPNIMTGTWGGTMCLTEAGAGSDVGNLKTTAKPIEGKDGWYKIKGTKIFISSGDSDLYENNIHLVLARTPGAPEGTKGISLFVTPKIKVNEDGTLGKANDVNCPSVEHKMGIHASATAVLNFGENDDCEGYLIGNEFEGMQNMFIMMNEARLDCALQGDGQSNLVYELTKQYVSERVQFGTEIVNHPDVRKSMLKMRAMCRGIRALTLYTGNLFDMAHEDKKYEAYVALLTPVCKSFCTEQGVNIAIDAVQAHGGYGYCSEYGIEQFVRDAKIATIYEGTNGIQAIDFVLRKILKDGGAAFKSLSGEIVASIGTLSGDFNSEKEIFGNALNASQEAMAYMGKFAAEKNMNPVLQSCSDFLNLNAHIIVAWRLMECVKIAQAKLPAAQGEEKEYLESKIVDFKIYCSQFLVQSVTLSHSITKMDGEFTKYPL